VIKQNAGMDLQRFLQSVRVNLSAFPALEQSVNRYGHCNFKPQEILNSVQGLFLWVNYGIVPPSGNVTIP